MEKQENGGRKFSKKEKLEILDEAKAHAVNPFEWLTNTLDKIADTKRSKLYTLLPGYDQSWEEEVDL